MLINLTAIWFVNYGGFIIVLKTDENILIWFLS